MFYLSYSHIVLFKHPVVLLTFSAWYLISPSMCWYLYIVIPSYIISIMCSVLVLSTSNLHLWKLLLIQFLSWNHHVAQHFTAMLNLWSKLCRLPSFCAFSTTLSAYQNIFMFLFPNLYPFPLFTLFIILAITKLNTVWCLKSNLV